MRSWTKAAELNELKALAEKLGPQSYCGPWLASVLVEVEADMRSDMGPTPSVVDVRSEQQRLREQDAALRGEKAALEIERRNVEERWRSLQREQEALRQAVREAQQGLGQAGIIITRLARTV